MTGPADTADDSSIWEERIFGAKIPFPKDDPRYVEWLLFAGSITEADERLKAKLLQASQDGSGSLHEWVFEFFTGRFDIFAAALLTTVRNYRRAAALKEGLAAAAERLLHLLRSTKLPDYIRRVDLVTDVKRRLQQRSAHWYAEALKAAREAHDASQKTNPAPPTITTSAAAAAIPVDSRSRDQALAPALSAALTTSDAVADVDGTSASKRNESLTAVPAPSTGTTVWSDVEIRFLSDLKIQSVVKGKAQEPQNYADLGFADRRSVASKPRAAWETLRRLAESGGVISSTPTAAEWLKVEKRIQEIRTCLRGSFRIEGDPVPYIDGAYKTRFKIVLTPPYDV